MSSVGVGAPGQKEESVAASPPAAPPPAWPSALQEAAPSRWGAVRTGLGSPREPADTHGAVQVHMLIYELTIHGESVCWENDPRRMWTRGWREMC